MLAKILQPKIIALCLWLCALAMLAVIAQQLPIATISQLLSTLSGWQWSLWILLNIGIIAIAVQRWRVLLQLLQIPVRYGRLLLIRQAGQAVSFITPGPQFGGEPLQVYWLWRRSGLPLHRALLGVGLDRFYELWINFAVLLLSVSLLLLATDTVGDYWWKIIASLLGALFLLSLLAWLLARHPQRLLAWLKPLASRWHNHPRLQTIATHWQQLGRDLISLLHLERAGLSVAAAWSLLGWAGLMAELWLMLSFFTAQMDLYSFLLIFVAMRLSFLLPLPGGIGTLEAAIFWSCQHLDIAPTAALGVIALMRLRDLIVLMAGLLCARLLREPAAAGREIGE